MPETSALESLHVFVVAAALGGLIGLERELARKPAGLRTHILVAVSAALLMELADGIARHFIQELGHERVSIDPIRIIQAIVVGISFLGAGTIIQGNGGRVEGLTTAASILLTAALGIAVALRQFALASSLAAAISLVLYALGKAEEHLAPLQEKMQPDPGPDAPAAQGEARRSHRRRRAPPGSD